MKQLFIFFSLFLFLCESQSQSVISTTGGGGIIGNMAIDYTLGEVIITTIENGNIKLSQGFHQPYFFVTAFNESFPIGTIKVFPNPTNSILTVQLTDLEVSNISISLTNEIGKIILTSKTRSTIWNTDLSNLSSGCYILTLNDSKNHKTNSFKIIKLN
jgi:hypothetical protein